MVLVSRRAVTFPILGGAASFGIGQDMANGLAALLNTTPAEAGFILGALMTVALIIVALILGSSLDSGAGMVGAAMSAMTASGIAISVLMTWWPNWTVVLVALFTAAAIIGPFRSASEG